MYVTWETATMLFAYGVRSDLHSLQIFLRVETEETERSGLPKAWRTKGKTLLSITGWSANHSAKAPVERAVQTLNEKVFMVSIFYTFIQFDFMKWTEKHLNHPWKQAHLLWTSRCQLVGRCWCWFWGWVQSGLGWRQSNSHLLSLLLTGSHIVRLLCAAGEWIKEYKYIDKSQNESDDWQKS